MKETNDGRSRLTSGIILVLLVSFSFYLEYRGTFIPFSLTAYDVYQRWRRQIAEPALKEPFATVFLLDSSRLSAVGASVGDRDVVALIEAIACGKPAVIGVDWRSGEWNPDLLQRLKTGPAAKVPIVWAREHLPDGTLGKVAGSVSLAGNWRAGPAELSADWDRAIRRTNRKVGAIDGFAWSVAIEVCQSGRLNNAPGCEEIRKCITGECPNESLLDFSDGTGRVNRFDTSQFGTLNGSGPVNCDALPSKGGNAFVENKVVLIGDAAASDMHDTPEGRAHGVSLMAHAIQGELLGGQIHEQHGPLVFALHLASVGLVLLFNRLSPFKALLANAVGIPVFAALFSYLAFHSLHHWFNFVPIIGGVLIHQLYEQAEHGEHQLKKIAELEAKIRGGPTSGAASPTP